MRAVPVIRPNPLTGAAVVRAAVQLADERGIDAVTMRGLGAKVGVGAMALYNYVTGREALLDAMIADRLGQLTPQLRPTASPCTSGPAAYLERSARAVRSLALAHPWLIRLMVVRPPLDPAMSAPLTNPAALACTDLVLSALTRHHVDDAACIRTFRSFCAFLLGHLLLEIPRADDRSDPRKHQPAPPLSPIPRAQLLNRLTSLTASETAAEFDRSLQAFLSTLDRQRGLDRPGDAQPAAASSAARTPGPAPGLVDTLATHLQDALTQPDREAASPTTKPSAPVPAAPVTERHVV
jgi:AcrR family transcriptional regulator